MIEVRGLLYYGCRKCQGLFPNVCELSEHMCKCNGVKVLQSGVHRYAYESSHLKKFMECSKTCSHTEDCPFQNYESGPTEHQQMATTTFYIDNATMERNRANLDKHGRQQEDCTTVIIPAPDQIVKAPHSAGEGNGPLSTCTTTGQDPPSTNTSMALDEELIEILVESATDNTTEECMTSSSQSNFGVPFVASDPVTSDLVQVVSEPELPQDLQLRQSQSIYKILSESTISSVGEQKATATVPRRVPVALTEGISSQLSQARKSTSSAIQKLHNCHFCSQRFPTKAMFTCHVLTHTDKLYRCFHCKYSCGSQQQLTHHEEGHRVELIGCAIDGCIFKCKNASLLRTHHILKHANRPSAKKRSPCVEVSTNASAPSLRQNKEVHTRSKQYRCRVCDHIFYTKEELKAHIASHKRGIRYACNECDYKCCQRSAMTRHIMNHRGMKGWQCLACGFMSARKNDVHRHILKRHKEYDNVKDALVNLGTKLNLNIDQYMLPQKRTKDGPQPSESAINMQSLKPEDMLKSTPTEYNGDAVTATTAQSSEEDSSAINGMPGLQSASRSEDIGIEHLMNPNSEINIEDLLALGCHIDMGEGLGVYDTLSTPMSLSPNTAFSQIPWPVNDCHEFGVMGEMMGAEDDMDDQEDGHCQLIGDNL